MGAPTEVGGKPTTCEKALQGHRIATQAPQPALQADSVG